MNTKIQIKNAFKELGILKIDTNLLSECEDQINSLVSSKEEKIIAKRDRRIEKIKSDSKKECEQLKQFAIDKVLSPKNLVNVMTTSDRQQKAPPATPESES